MNITVDTNGQKDCTDVFLQVVTDLDCTQSQIPFKWECGQAYVAQLLKNHIRQLIRDQLKAIRRKAYNQGWRDKASKNRKATAFHGDWAPDDVGWVND